MDSFDTLKEIDQIKLSDSLKCSIQELKLKTDNSTHNLIISTQNIRSIYKNFDDLQLTLAQLKYEIDVLILTECQLNPDKNVPHLVNYTYFRTKHLINKCDGVVVYTKNKLSAKFKELNLINATGIELQISNYTILGIYRSPSFLNAGNFISSLNNHLENITPGKNILILGDINIDLIISPIETNQERTNRLNYLNMLSLHGLFSAHNLPTRRDGCLDHVILRLDAKNNTAFTAVLDTTITDHSLVLLSLENKYHQTLPQKYKTVVNYNNAYKSLINIDVSFFNIFNDPDTYAFALIEMVKTAILANTRNIIVSNSKRSLKPWITTGALRCIRLRNAIYQKLNSNPLNQILAITYKRYRTFCGNLIKKLKRKYNKDKIKASVHSPRALWSTINEITHYKPPKSRNGDLLSIKSSPQTSINYVNKYFISIGQTLAENISTSFVPSVSGCTDNYNHLSSFVLLDTCHREVENTLMSLDSKSAPGWDGISTLFLKQTKDILVPLISDLANLCFSTGIFPFLLKRSIVTPVYKGGESDDVNNYRPISVLASISKIIEKLLNTRIVNYLTKYNILSSSQYGFRKGMSTQDAITDLTSVITKEIDKGNKCLVVFLDLKKAFDTVSASILIRRLESIGFRGTALSLLSSYLQNRKQCVKIDGFLSDEEDVTFGVPQGSVLGPTLFLIYINNLCNLRGVGGRILSYADDTAIVFTGKTWEKVKLEAEKGLARVSEWLCENLLTLNTQKTNFVCFAPYINSQPLPDFEIRIHSCSLTLPNTCNCPKIQKVSSVKYLGIIVDQRLSWYPHLEVTIGRVRKLMWVFKSLRHVMSTEILNKIYIALAQSVIIYCISVWGGAAKSHFIDLERAQRSLIKVMYCKPFRFPTESLYDISKLLSVRKLYILHLILGYHKALPLDRAKLSKRRCDVVAPTYRARLVFARRQYIAQAPHVYNKINRQLKIYPMQLFECRKTLNKWLSTLNYDQVEDILARMT